MTLKEVKAVCKEMGLVYNCGLNDCYIYTQKFQWIACYYTLCEQAIVFNSGLPMIDNKDDFREGLKLKLKQLKEESIKERINSLEKDFV